MFLGDLTFLEDVMKRFFADPRRVSTVFLAVLATLPPAPGEQTAPVVRLPASNTAELPIDGNVADILLEDLNADGFPDLVVAANDGGDGSPSFLFLSREGKFHKPSWTSADESVSGGAALGDLDGDRDPDLVLVRYNHNRAVAYRNLGKGKLESEPFWESADTEWASAAFIDDFDHDGHADILAKGYSGNHRIYPGTKDGPSPEASWRAKTEWAASASALVDVDGDGRKDLVTTSWIGPAYAIFRGREKLFDTQPSLASKHLGEHGGLAVGDLDGDGFPEIAAGSRCHRQGDGRVRLYANRKGSPSSEPVWLSDDVDASVSELVFHDLDRDGDLDLFVLSGDHTAAYASKKGALAKSPSWRASIEGENARIADLNLDGYPDLLVGGRGSVKILHGGPGVEPSEAQPFPGMPKLSEPPEKVEITEAFGLKLAPLTPGLKEHYGLDVASGVVVLGAPEDAAWRIEIGNLRVGDVIVGVGSLGDYGRQVEPVKDPSGFLALVLEYGKQSESHLVGLQWRCGPLHPSSKGEARPERFRLSKEHWAWLVTKFGEPVPREPEVKQRQGAIIALDPEGKEHGEEDGTFTFVLWSGRSGTHQAVEVAKGQWAARVPSNVELGVAKVRLGSRAAYAERERIPIPEDGDLTIHVKWFSSTRLRVLAADTKADLDRLEVVTGLGWEQEENAHPGAYGEGNLVHPAARSPIELEVAGEDQGTLQQTYWVRAPGYAWGRIEVDHRTGGERTLVLERGGDLEVTLGNYRPASKAVLRLRRPIDLSSVPAKALVAAVLKQQGKTQEDGTPSIAEIRKGAFELLKAGGLGEELQEVLEDLSESRRPFIEMPPGVHGPTTISGIAPGSYEIAAEIGRWYKEPIALGQASVEVRADERAQVFVALQDPPAPAQPVPLEGTIAIHPAWGRMAFDLTVFGDGVGAEGGRGFLNIERSRMQLVDGKPGVVRWSAGRVRPGTYRLKVSGLGYQRQIEVGPSGARDVRIEIGEPADVAVRAVDSETGEDVDIAQMDWSLKLDDGHRGSGEDVERDAGDGKFHFRAPTGEIVLSLHDARFGWTQETVRIHRGQKEHTLRLERACGFRVLLKDGDATVPINWPSHKLEAKRTDGTGEASGWGSDETGFRVTVSAPGLYQVTLGPIEGYEPIPVQEVAVKPREFVELVVKLARKE